MKTTVYDLAQKYAGVVAEVHYVGPDGHTYNTGLLTTDRAESSRGQVVFVAGANARLHDPLCGDIAYGPGELPPGYCLITHSLSHHLHRDLPIEEYQRILLSARAIYAWRPSEEPDHI